MFTASSSSRGGGEHYWVLLAGGLVRLGCQVQVLVSDHPRMDPLVAQFDSGVTVRRVAYRSCYDRATRAVGAALDRRAAANAAAWIAQSRPDILHLNKQNIEDGLDLVRGARRWGGPAVATVHVTHSPAELGAAGGRLRAWCSKRVLRRAELPVITVSAACAEQYQRFLSRKDEVPAVAIWNGIQPPVAGDREALRRQWNIEANEILLGCTARLEDQKNPLFLIRKVLPRLSPHVKLVWVGDGALRAASESAAVAAGVADRVVFAGWRDDAAACLSAFDVFVLPSRYEGFPFSILEAMAAALPCVASDVDGMSESVLEGITGRLCPVDDAAGWMEALSPLIDDRELREQMGRRGRERYEAEFTVEAMTRKTLDYYHQIIAGHRTASRSMASPNRPDIDRS